MSFLSLVISAATCTQLSVPESVPPEPELLRLLQFGGSQQSKEITAALSHPHPEIRRRALWASRSFHRPDAPFAIRALDDPESHVRLAALNVLKSEFRLAVILKKQTPDLTSVIDRIIGLLQVDPPEMQSACAGVLGYIGSGRPEVVAALVTAAHEDTPVAAAAIAALIQLNADCGFGLTRTANRLTRRSLPELLAVNPATDVRPRVWQFLVCDSDAQVRIACLRYVQNGDRDIPRVLNEVVRQWSFPDSEVQDSAVQAFETISLKEPEDDVETVLDALVQIDSGWKHRINVWQRLGHAIEGRAASFVRLLLDPETPLRRRIEMAGVFSQSDRVSDNNVDDDELQQFLIDKAFDEQVPLVVRIGIARGLSNEAEWRRGNSGKKLRRRLLSIFAEAVSSDIPLPFRMMALSEIRNAVDDDPAARELIVDLFDREFRVIRRSTDANSESSALAGKWRARLVSARVGVPIRKPLSEDVLMSAADDISPDVRLWAAQRVFNSLSSKNRKTEWNAVIGMFNDSDARVRSIGLQSLAYFPNHTDESHQLAVTQLDDPDSRVRDDAITILEELGGDVSPAVNRLRQELTSLEKSEGWSPSAMWPHRRIGILERLIWLAPEDPGIQADVLRTFRAEPTRLPGLKLIAQLVPHLPDILPEVAALLDEPYPELRAGAADALVYFGDGSRKSLPRLQQLLSDRDASVHEAAARAVLTLEPDHELARSIVGRTIAHECGGRWCYSQPPALTCVARLKERGLPALRLGLDGAEPFWRQDHLRQLHQRWKTDPGGHGYLEILLREHGLIPEAKSGE
jgi:HEAT repeat protein